jgi:hypothetical protein
MVITDSYNDEQHVCTLHNTCKLDYTYSLNCVALKNRLNCMYRFLSWLAFAAGSEVRLGSKLNLQKRWFQKLSQEYPFIFFYRDHSTSVHPSSVPRKCTKHDLGTGRLTENSRVTGHDNRASIHYIHICMRQMYTNIAVRSLTLASKVDMSPI